MAPLVAVYPSDLDRLIEAARAQTILTHNNRAVVASAEFFARVVVQVLQGSKPTAAIEAAGAEVADREALEGWLSDGMDSRSLDSRPAIADFGQMCEIEAALPATIHLIAKYEDNFKQAMIANVMAGGDSASRGMLAGMVLGAYHGTAAIPESWMMALNSRDRIDRCLGALKA